MLYSRNYNIVSQLYFNKNNPYIFIMKKEIKENWKWASPNKLTWGVILVLTVEAVDQLTLTLNAHVSCGARGLHHLCWLTLVTLCLLLQGWPPPGHGTLAPSPLPVSEPAVGVTVGMPVHHRKSDSWEMDPDSSPGCRLGDLSRGSSLESQASSSRSRSLTLVSDCFSGALCAWMLADFAPLSGVCYSILLG